MMRIVQMKIGFLHLK